MQDLRVYINLPGMEDEPAHKVFYSRRADGPYYRWTYDATREEWHSLRVNLSVWRSRALSLLNLRDIPAALQEELGEHYVE